MAFAEGLARGSQLARGMIDTYQDANQTARMRAAEQEIAALNEQYARSGEMIEDPQGLGPITGPQVYAAPSVVPEGISRTNMQTGVQAPVGQPPTPTTPFSGQTLGGAPAAPVAQPAAPVAQPAAPRAPVAPTPQSQQFREQAAVYARHGLSADAQRFRELASQAENAERRETTEAQRYETGLRREDARTDEQNRQWWSTHNMNLSTHERAQQREDDTAAALAALGAVAASGASPLELLDEHPNADYGVLLDAYTANYNINERAALNTAFGKLNERLKDKDVDVITAIDEIAGENINLASALMLHWGTRNEATIEAMKIQIAKDINAFGRANNVEQFNKLAADHYGGGKWVEMSSLDPDALAAEGITPERAKGAWVFRREGKIIGDAGVYYDAGGQSGWRFARDNMVSALQGQNPLAGTIAMNSLNSALDEGGRLDPATTLNIAEEARRQATNSANQFNQELYNERYQELYNTVLNGGALPERPQTPAEAENVSNWFQGLGGGGGMPIQNQAADTPQPPQTQATETPVGLDRSADTPQPPQTQATETPVGLGQSAPMPPYRAQRAEQEQARNTKLEETQRRLFPDLGIDRGTRERDARVAELQLELQHIAAMLGGRPVAENTRGRAVIEELTQLLGN